MHREHESGRRGSAGLRTILTGAVALALFVTLVALAPESLGADRSSASSTAITTTAPYTPAAARGAADLGPETAAWLPYWSLATGLAGFSAGRAPLTSVSPFWFDVTSCGRIVTHASSRTAADTVRRLRLRGVTVVPTLTASGLDPARAVACLGTARTREEHVAKILDLVRSGGYDGIDLDYEHLALTRNQASAGKVRVALNSFVGSLCPRLQALGKQCIVTVMARTGGVTVGTGGTTSTTAPTGSDGVWQGTLSLDAYDYATIGAAASRVRVMAYDEHTRRSPAGPIASYPWVQAVARYATSLIPAEKLTLGIPSYGRDWSGGTARTLSRDQALTLARSLRVTPRWDPSAREYTFTYRARGVRHTVWFPGTRGILERDRLARSLGLGSVVWAAGLEPTDMWRTMRADRLGAGR